MLPDIKMAPNFTFILECRRNSSKGNFHFFNFYHFGLTTLSNQQFNKLPYMPSFREKMRPKSKHFSVNLVFRSKMRFSTVPDIPDITYSRWNVLREGLVLCLLTEAPIPPYTATLDFYGTMNLFRNLCFLSKKRFF